MTSKGRTWLGASSHGIAARQQLFLQPGTKWGFGEKRCAPYKPQNPKRVFSEALKKCRVQGLVRRATFHFLSKAAAPCLLECAGTDHVLM